MRPIRTPSCARVLAGSALVFLFAASSAFAQKPTWAKHAAAFPGSCRSDLPVKCPALRIPSPDHESFVEVQYRKVSSGDGGWFSFVELGVTRKDGTSTGIAQRGLIEDEVLWSPDSKAVLINGSDGAEGPQYLYVYHLGEPGSRPLDVATAQKGMRTSFPPCKAKYAPKDCALAAEDINVIAVDWTHGSSAVVVMAEMPCSSSVGGIRCQVLGYELEVSTDKILRRMEPKEFAARWQHSMAWTFHDPGPADYERK